MKRPAWEVIIWGFVFAALVAFQPATVKEHWAGFLSCAVWLMVITPTISALHRIADGMDSVREMAELLTKQAKRDDERQAEREPKT